MNSTSVLSRSTTAYQIVPADLTRDAAAIIGVWSRNFPELTAEQHRTRFEWNYCLGPYGPGRCWLLLAGDTVVGTAGLGMRRLQTGGRSFLTGLASDLAVDAQHRSLQPALMLQKKVLGALDADVSLVYGLPNRKSIGVFRRLGYSPVAKIGRLVKVLRIERYLEQRNTLPMLAQRLVAAPANLGIKMASPETWRKPHGTIVRELPSFDGRFDDLAARIHCPELLTTVRSSEYLKWRYADYPLCKYVTIGLVTPDESRLAGYAVVYTGPNDQVTLVDFCHDNNPHSGEDLMGAVVSWARRRQATCIEMETYGSGELDRLLRRFGFSSREQNMELMAMVAGHSAASLTGVLDRWYYVSGDEDYN